MMTARAIRVTRMTRTSKGTMSVKEAGRKGGQSTSRQHGPQFYHEIGTKGGQRVKDLIKKGKQTETTTRSRTRTRTKTKTR